MLKPNILKELNRLFGKGFVLSDPETLLSYSYDAARIEFIPEAVVFARTEEQISALLRLANAEKLPITPRGAGSGLSGGSVPIHGGVVLSLERLNRLVALDPANRLITVQPGVVTADIDTAAAAHGLFYPPDPGSVGFSTIGGNVAENAGGLRGLKYGVTKDYVKVLHTVLPTGETVRLGSPTIKHVAGLNLEQLLVGSEGTLGVFTQITLSLLPLPEHRETALAAFPTLEAAGQTVAAIIAAGVTPATLEILDRLTIQAIEDFQPSHYPRSAAAVLLIETDGHRETAEKEMQQVSALAHRNGADSILRPATAAERERLLEGRRAALSALTRLSPTTLLEDATVLRSRVPDLLRGIDRIAQKYNLLIGTFGHAGDGNLHPTFLFDKKDPAQVARLEQAVDELFELTLQLDGTISGEHGIGIEKRPFLKRQLGEAGIELIKKIKSSLDPNGILNPGKIVA